MGDVGGTVSVGDAGWIVALIGSFFACGLVSVGAVGAFAFAPPHAASAIPATTTTRREKTLHTPRCMAISSVPAPGNTNVLRRVQARKTLPSAEVMVPTLADLRANLRRLAAVVVEEQPSDPLDRRDPAFIRDERGW